MAKTRKRITKKPHYGNIPVRKNCVPLLLPALPFLALGATAFVAWKGYTAYQRLTRPAVLLGAGVGAVVGFRVGRSLVEKLAYTVVGTGVGMLVDTYVLGNEE
jgi:hypothetical protein